MPDQQHNPTHSSTKRSPQNKITWGVPLLLVIAVTAVGIRYWSNRDGDTIHAADGQIVRSALHLDTFVLNLADTQQRSYLRVGIDLGLGLEPKHPAEGYPIARVRDTILSVLATGKADDLVTAQGKMQLKQNLLSALQERVPELQVREVYFTEFLIQR